MNEEPEQEYQCEGCGRKTTYSGIFVSALLHRGRYVYVCSKGSTKVLGDVPKVTCLRKVRDRHKLCLGCGRPSADKWASGHLCHRCIYDLGDLERTRKAAEKRQAEIDAAADPNGLNYKIEFNAFDDAFGGNHSSVAFVESLLHAIAPNPATTDPELDTRTFSKWGTGYRSGSRCVNITANQANAIKRLAETVEALIKRAKKRGYEEGRSILKQLYDGDLSMTGADDRDKRQQRALNDE